MTTQNTIQVIDTAKVQVLTLGTLQTEQLNKDPWSLATTQANNTSNFVSL